MACCEDRVRGTLSTISAVAAGVATLCTAIGSAGASVSRTALQDMHWITAVSSGNPIMQKGDIFAGFNAIYVKGVDDDVVKYIDCVDDADVCETCSSVSVGITTMLVFSTIVGLCTCMFCIVSICKPRWYFTCAAFGMISLVLAASSLGSFDNCFYAFQDQEGVSNVKYNGGSSIVIASTVVMTASVVLSAMGLYLENRDDGAGSSVFPS